MAERRRSQEAALEELAAEVLRRTAQVSASEVLTEEMVAERLTVPVATVRALVRRGELPVLRVGKHRRFSSIDVDRLLLRVRAAALAELTPTDTNRSELT